MTNKKSLKRALVASAIALILCFTMLLGTTYAWFTDTVTSAGNIIKSGTLDIEMDWADGKEDPTTTTAWADASQGAIFNYTLWEPGYVQVRHVRIKNVGTLALKYSLRIQTTGAASELADVIDVYFIDPATQVTDRAALTDAYKVGTLADVLAGSITGTEGELLPGEANNPTTANVTIALKMQETAGNEYQDKSIGTEFAIQLFATQLTYESDSFDNQYDVNAPDATKAQTNKLAKMLSEAAPGSTVELGAMNYGLLTLSSGSYAYDYPANLTIVGQEGTAFTGISVGNETITGWTFKDIAFIGDPNDNTGNVDGMHFSTKAVVDGLTLENCTFSNGAAFSMIKDAADVAFKNVTINNCTFGATDGIPAILAQGVNGLTVTDSTFSDAGYNMLQTNKTSGTVVITGNTVYDAGSRAIRMVTLAGADLTISGNTFFNADNQNDEDVAARGQIIKVTGAVVDGDFTGNTHNGNAVVVTNGIGVEA